MPGHPDANLHPEASGPAKALVDKHAGEQQLKLYAGWFCPFVQRVWIALEEKGIPYQYIEVNPYNKPQSLLSLNPRGLVPTLSCPGPDGSSQPLFESNVVLEYLEEAYPDHKPHLQPTHPYERARARIWIDYVTTRIIPAFHRFLQYQPQDGEDASAGIEKPRAEFLSHLKAWTKEMHPEGPFFLGKEMGLPDIVLAPWAIRLWVFDEYKPGGLGIPGDGEGSAEDQAIWKRWKKWMSAVEGTKSVQDTMSEKEHYLPIYKRYADNVALSELAKATRAGRGVP